ncbi:MAG: hypothetical protein R3F59_05675 [Myxococcota bacterium]
MEYTTGVTLLTSLTAIAAAQTCDAYDPPASLAEVRGSSVEASGLTFAHLRDGVLFTHGDQGDEPVIVSFRTDGTLLDEHRVTNADNTDWEDIASAPCPDEGWCLYIGDIGDNHRDHDKITVYVVREPEAGQTRVRAIERYVAVYPDGPHDAESLLVDPCSGRITVVTKEDDGASQVYQYPPLDAIDGVVTLTRIAGLALPGPTATSRAATGGAFSDDGDELAVRTGDRIFLWTVDRDAPNAHWTAPPLELVGSVEHDGEGVAFGPGGDLYTVGEGQPIPLSLAPCTTPGPASEATCAFPQTGRRCGCSGAPGSGATGALLALALLARRRRTTAGR